jgi:hypothetical protein
MTEMTGRNIVIPEGVSYPHYSIVPLIKEAFIIVKYIYITYAMEYSLKSLHLLNISLHLLNYRLSQRFAQARRECRLGSWILESLRL